MRYIGSKRRVFKYIKPFLKQHLHQSNMRYYEPFVGGCNSLIQFNYQGLKRYGWDINHYLIAMWQELQKGWQPPEFISEDKYKHIKQNQSEYAECLVGYVGVMISFGSKWFDSYANEMTSTVRHLSSSRKIVMQAQKLKDIQFRCKDFFKCWEQIPYNSIVYCDPPYQEDGIKGYAFETSKLYEVYRELSKHCYVYISEKVKSMPGDFISLLERDMQHTNKGSTRKWIECLYTYEGGLAHKNQDMFAQMQSEALL